MDESGSEMIHKSSPRAKPDNGMMAHHFRIGWARRDITPPIGIPLSGYGFFQDRRAVAVGDPLYARAVALGNDEPALILALDLLGLDSVMVGRLRREIGARTGLGKDCIMLTCTHTHSGPSVIPLRGDPRRRGGYLRKLVEEAARAGEEATEATRRVDRSLRFRVRFAGFSYNRAFADGPVSRRVHGIAFRADTRTVALANYACHPVTMGGNKEISADYPGSFNELMARAGVSSVFLTGPCGDLDPIASEAGPRRGTRQCTDRYAGMLSRAALRGISIGKSFKADGVSATCISFRAGYAIPTRESVSDALEKARQVVEDPKNKARFQIDWAEETLRMLESHRHARSATLCIQAFTIGEAVVLALPGEVFFEFGEAIRSHFPGLEILIATNANSVIGYIPSKRDFEAGGYASDASCKFYRRFPFEPDVGDKVVDRSVQLLRSLV